MCRRQLGAWWVGVLVLLPSGASAGQLENGKDVYGPCAACHGANGEGGKGGEYPRLAGQPPVYLVGQLKLYQERKRYNVAMFPYTEPRELSEADMQDVAAYLTQITLPAKTPVFKDTDSALDRLLAMERVLVVPRVAGDVENGKATFKRSCVSCHGPEGRGKKNNPVLLGQYPDYLQRQVDAFRKGDRPHDKKTAGEGVFFKLEQKDVVDIFAYLTAIQDKDPEVPAAGSSTAGSGAAAE
ncbi:MAG: c-type cytochrome [Deltaproteobacteria bacterium]|nr:c-type cytochrome [Deltaproteobacteria bacterium]